VKILLIKDSVGLTHGLHLIAVFGVGLVGHAICVELARAGARCALDVPVNWSTPLSVEDAVCRICEAAHSAAEESVLPLRISVVWAAGSAGFQSPEAAHVLELEHLKVVLSLGERLAHAGPMWARRFFLISSAGGLFEGQSNVGPESIPQPLRAYGSFKLLQERALSSTGGFHTSFVYRPSTIYGHSPKGRLGLVSALLLNGIRRRVSTISGNATTLRDYVLSGDVGRFIAAEILTPEEIKGPCIRFLVSGKPSSILEITRVVEELLCRKLYLSYALMPQNALHNTYSRTAVPHNWRSASIREGIQTVLRNLIS
jgi:nucleoside-diphosphate-sugar epimerase